MAATPEAQAYDVFSDRCPSRAVLDDVVGRWPSLVLVALRDDPRRFAEAARSIGGISDRMLARTLATLVGRGLVVRTQAGSQRVEYSLTAAGRRVADALADVVRAVYDVMPALTP